MNAAGIIEKVTDSLLKIIETEGELPWIKSWDNFQLPKNGMTKFAYNGVNLYLSFLPYAVQEYYTFKQIKQMGHRIKENEKGNVIAYWSIIQSKEVDEETGKPKTFPLLKYYYVWNVAQTTIPVPEIKERTTIKEGEDILNGYKDKPEISYMGDRAYYSPSSDKVVVPPGFSFKESEEFYSTLFHELVHSTGHEKRLGRDMSGIFGDDRYSKEELVAELGSAFLCGIAGMKSRGRVRNHAAYLKGWMSKLKEDKKMFFDAMSKASKAINYIVGEI